MEFHSRDSEYPGFEEVPEALMSRTWGAPPPGEPRAELIQQAVERLTVDRLVQLAADSTALSQVRAIASNVLLELAESLDGAVSPHDRTTRDDIWRFLQRPDATYSPTSVPLTPPGDPIGAPSLPRR